MSEHVTHIALCDDGRRLAAATPGLAAGLNRAWEANREMGRAGGITRQADKFSAEIVAAARDGCEGADGKLAFVLGALTHRAADRLMKPVFQHFKDEPGYDGINRATIYCDAFILKNVLKVYPDHMLQGEGTAAEAKLDDVVRASIGRALIELHTFKPDVEDIHAWLDRLDSAKQEYRMRLDIYRQVYTDWPADQVKRYIDDTHFYDESDPMIDVAATLRDGGSVDGATLDAAVEATGEHSSRYARALAQANRYIRAAGELYEGRATVDETKPKLDIGVPEYSIPFTPKG